MKPFLLLLLLTGSPLLVGQPDQEFQSGPSHVHLIELYTSEGCSSCPAAESWLSEFSENPALWVKFVPVAFHVDYWNNLGWPDPFSRKEFTERQERYASLGGSSSVYTPEVIIDGKEIRGWKASTTLDNLANEMTAILKVTISGSKVNAWFRPNTPPHSQLTFRVALLGNDIKSQINAGENQGSILVHDFTVLTLSSSPCSASSDGKEYTAATSLPASLKYQVKFLSAWIEDDESGHPVQALGGTFDSRP